ncbi:MAG: EF-hand domain-containing protein [Parvularcula sp.]
MKFMLPRITGSTLLASVLLLGVGSALAQPPERRGPPADTNGDGIVSRAEMEASVDARFEQSDSDGDGYVSQDEAQAQRRARMEERRAKMKERRKEREHRGPRGGHPGHPQPMWDEVDADQDGRLSRDEMSANAARRFDRADTNGDGQVTRDEMRAQMEARRAERMAPQEDE